MIFKTIGDETTLSGQRIVSVFEARKIAQEQAAKQLVERYTIFKGSFKNV